MPPKTKITKQQLLIHAYDITLEFGIDAVTSRSVAKAAGCSIQPVFSHFPTMEALRRETYLYACKLVNDQIMTTQFSNDLSNQPMGIILKLAKEKPNIFELIYLSGNLFGEELWQVMQPWECNNKTIEFFSKKYVLKDDECRDIFERVFYLFFGIATMVAKGKINIPDKEVFTMIQRTVNDLITVKHRKSTQ